MFGAKALTVGRKHPLNKLGTVYYRILKAGEWDGIKPLLDVYYIQLKIPRK